MTSLPGGAEWSEGPEGDMAGAGGGQIRCQGGEREIDGECLQHNELKRAKGRLDEQLDVSYDHFRIESTFLWISLPRTTLIHDTSLCNDPIRSRLCGALSLSPCYFEVGDWLYPSATWSGHWGA